MPAAAKPNTTNRRDKPVPQAAPAPAELDEAAALRLVAQRRIHQAQELERERKDVQDRIGVNRTQLRQMRDADELPADLVKWVDTWYPEKEKGTTREKDEIEATRKLREAARKDGNS